MSHGSGLAALPSTRRNLLLAIRRRGEASADDLATASGITLSAIRQQLSVLSGDGLIEHRQVLSGPGRPRHLFRLTDQAIELFPDLYRPLVLGLLRMFAGDPADFATIWGQLSAESQAELVRRTAGRPLADRVAEIARMVAELGFIAEAEALPRDAHALRILSCPLAEIAGHYPYVCEAELRSFEDATGADVQRVAIVTAGAPFCEYVIRAAAENSG
jgi:predicted ArsR family transcriptional regulator